MPGSIVRLFSAVLAVVLVVPASSAGAHPIGPSASYVVSVEDTEGRSLPTFHHRGRTYVLGLNGRRYDVRIENHTGRRVEAVLSVDGRDAVSGRKGDYVGERGYVIDAWSEVVVEGFRSSHDEVAAFRFTDPSNSYSARTGTPENVGVIGVAFFPERSKPVTRWWYDEHEVARPRPRPHGEPSRRELSSRDAVDDARAAGGPPADRDAMSGAATESAPAAKAGRSTRASSPSGAYAERESRSLQNLGTEYGEALDSHVHEVEFARASDRHPDELVTLYYDDREGLEARGIRVHRPRPIVDRGPDPFPGRFAPPPPRNR